MTGQKEPECLTRDIVDAIHEDQIHTFGGLHGVRNGARVGSRSGSGCLPLRGCKLAGAYAYYLAESQACFDGNKRTGVQASLVFLEGCGIDISQLPEQQTYDLIIKIATRQAAAATLPSIFAPS
jgi:hypothetical protein